MQTTSRITRGKFNKFLALISPSLRFNSRFSALATVILLCGLLLGACGPNPSDQTPTPTPPAGFKVSSVLVNIFTTYQTAPGSEADRQKAAIQYAREVGVINDKDEVAFELELDSPDREQAVTDKIKSMGGRVSSSANLEGTVKLRVNVPVDVFIKYSNSANKDNFLNDLAGFQGVKSINLLIGSSPREFNSMPDSAEALKQVAQVSQNEGVKLIGADKWHAAGFTGQGVKVGVIDIGFKYYEQFLGKTLPDDLVIKDIGQETDGDSSLDTSVHGTAVVEIIHSVAPDAKIFAASIDGSDSQYKAATEWLISQNVSIVSVSLGDHLSLADGNSAVERYLERVHKEKGIVFLLAAGNEASGHYAGFFNPDADGFHQFVPGVTRMIVGNPGKTAQRTYFTLVWEQWGLDKKQVNDLDLFVLDRNGKPVRSSQDAQSVRNPVEILPFTLQPREYYYVQVRQKPGTPAYTKPFRLHVYGDNLTLQFIVPQMSVGSPASSRGVLAVGAIEWSEDKWVYYSSQGPLPDGRFKPEVSGPTEVSSRAYEEEGRDSFGGTSAATPQVAGTAALLKGANPNMTADQLESLLKENIKDLSPEGLDFANGYGRVDLHNLNPVKGLLPQGKVAPTPQVDLTNLQFPVLTLDILYPTPQVGPATANKVNAPTPLPTRYWGLEDGATNDSRPGTPGVNNPTTPVPTSTPRSGTTTVTVEPVTNIDFSDNFKNPASGLPNSDQASYQDGSYRLKVQPGQLTWSSYPASQVSATDFGAEVTAQGLGKDGLYGLVFWQQDANNYFLLSVTGQGQYQISQYSNGAYKEVIGWTQASGWKSGGANNLRLVANNGALRVSINNQPGKTGQATGQGAIGFAAGSYGSAEEVAAFSDFRLSTTGN